MNDIFTGRTPKSPVLKFCLAPRPAASLHGSFYTKGQGQGRFFGDLGQLVPLAPHQRWNMAAVPCSPSPLPLLVYKTDNSLTHAPMGHFPMWQSHGRPEGCFAFFWELHKEKAGQEDTHPPPSSGRKGLCPETTQIETQQHGRHFTALRQLPSLLESGTCYQDYSSIQIWFRSQCLIFLALPS